MNKATTAHWHSKSSEETLSALESRVTGLTLREVERRRSRFGYNEIPEARSRPWIILLLRQFQSMLVLILFGAAFISWLTWHIIDMYVILAVIAINALIGFVQELRAERAVSSLKRMMTPWAKVLRDGSKQTLPARELVPGDIIVMEEGDSIPADARLIEAKNLRTIEAALTGESVPISKFVEPMHADTALADQKNMVRKSTFVVGGYAHAIVTGTGMDTAIGKIAASLGHIKVTKTHFQKKTNSLARQMGILSLLSASVLFAMMWYMERANVEEILLISIAALVSAIPEGLPAVLSIVLAIGAHRMSQRNAIIREFTATETLGAVTTIITDKTGTLTQNTLTVRRIGLQDESDIHVTGEGWLPAGNLLKDGRVIDTAHNSALSLLLRIAEWCNNAGIRHDIETDTYELIGDPTEGALIVLARKGVYLAEEGITTRKLDDLPFSSTLKMRATLTETGEHIQLMAIGAPEQILERCSKVRIGNHVREMDEHTIDTVHARIESWSGDAMRVIALAYRDEPKETTRIDAEGGLHGFTFVGIVGMIDPPRPDVKEAVRLCKQAGIRVIMATGDHINTAVAIARNTGILDDNHSGRHLALTEKQLLLLDDKEFSDVISSVDVFARLTPDMKLRIADTLQRRGELIAMTGDGVNDAPALKKADVGVAMGIMGTDVARDAAKMVLADDNFSTIVHAVEEGRIVFTNARQTTFFLVTTNFAEIITLLTAVASGMPIPLTATQLLWLNLVTDGVGDIALATERGHGDVLKEKPVNPKENILNKSILPFLLINATLMTVLAIGAFKWFLPVSLEKARSAAFIIMAFSQLYNVFNMRALKRSVFSIGIFSNKWINLALIVSVIIQVLIIEVPFFERMFRFDPISFTEFLVLALLASSVLWFGELYKYLRYGLKKH